MIVRSHVGTLTEYVEHSEDTTRVRSGRNISETHCAGKNRFRSEVRSRAVGLADEPEVIVTVAQ